MCLDGVCLGVAPIACVAPIARVCAGVALIALACQTPERPRAASASLILYDDTVWVASADDDALIGLDAATLEPRARVVIAGAPTHLARADGAFVVGLAQASEVAWVSETLEVRRVPVPCGGTGAALALPDGGALVACPNDDRLVLVRDGAHVATFDAPGRPTALALAAGRVYVSASRAGAVRSAPAEALDIDADVDVGPRALTTVAWETRRIEQTPGFAATQVDALAPSPEGVVASYQRVDVDSDRDRDPSRGGYGSLVDGAPRLEPRLLAPCGGRYARFDGGERVASGPSALAFDAARERLWIAHRQTGNVVLLACAPGRGLAEASDREARVLGALALGRGLEGLALAPDGSVYVDVAFDHAVAHVALADGWLVVRAQRTRPLGPTRLSTAALRGRALFFDARDPQLTPSGVVTCGSCHPAAGDDGLSWFLHTATVGPKLRRTLPAWSARPALAPYHRDGEFADARALTLSTLRALLEGDGLLVDLDAIVAFMQEAPAPPPRPIDDPAAVARGGELFASRCERCHTAGGRGSDGEMHAVVPLSADPLGVLAAALTPTLEAIRARAPYLHDGRAASLRDVLTVHDPEGTHGGGGLDPADLADLLTYLESL